MLDILLKDGFIVDGTRRPGYRGDVGIKDGQIVKIADSINENAAKTIVVSDKIIAPGFIDIHAHSDLCPFIPGLQPVSKLYQGITLEVCGNCGMSNLPVTDAARNRLNSYISKCMDISLHGVTLEDDSITDYVKHIERSPAATNIGVLIGHGTLRGCVVGMGMRAVTADEQAQMEHLLERELQRGALGMSLGLIYSPSSYGDVAEFVGLAKILKKYNAVLTVHLRIESQHIFEAVDEMLEVARLSGVRLQISHLKLIGTKQWGRSCELLKKIDTARQNGINVRCDQYPYTATSTGLVAVVPEWAMDGGYEVMCQRLIKPTPELLQSIRNEIQERGGADRILIVLTHGHAEHYEGLTLAKVAEDMNLSYEEAAVKLLILAKGSVTCCYFSLDENDMENIMQQDYIAVASDGYALSFDKSFMDYNPHPRSFGTFPRFFQLARDKKLLPLETAVYKATALPAEIIGVTDRGMLKEGYKADIVVFSWNDICDTATYLDSVKRPKGIDMVVIDGKIALINGEQVVPNFGKVVLHDVMC